MMNETAIRPRSPKAFVRASVLGAVFLAMTLAAGCASTGSGTAAPTSASTSSSPTTSSPSPEATPTPDACGPATGEEAAAAGIAALQPVPGLEGKKWVAANDGYSGYDACAALSWSIVTLEGATVSTPTQILLFHKGTYIGTATSTAYGFTPAVERTADGAISVTYRFNQGNESNAEASGRAVATFTWNDETDSVDMAGDLPPAY
jgi:hypothetical protein